MRPETEEIILYAMESHDNALQVLSDIIVECERRLALYRNDPTKTEEEIEKVANNLLDSKLLIELVKSKMK